MTLHQQTRLKWLNGVATFLSLWIITFKVIATVEWSSSCVRNYYRPPELGRIQDDYRSYDGCALGRIIYDKVVSLWPVNSFLSYIAYSSVTDIIAMVVTKVAWRIDDTVCWHFLSTTVIIYWSITFIYSAYLTFGLIWLWLVSYYQSFSRVYAQVGGVLTLLCISMCGMWLAAVALQAYALRELQKLRLQQIQSPPIQPIQIQPLPPIATIQPSAPPVYENLYPSLQPTPTPDGPNAHMVLAGF